MNTKARHAMQQTPTNTEVELDWCRTLTLEERCLVLRQTSRGGTKTAVASEVARGRYASWRAQRPFADRALFRKRLAVDGLTESEALQATEVSRLVATTPSGDLDWQADFSAALSQGEQTWCQQESCGNSQFAGLLVVAGPLIERFRDRLRHQMRGLPAGAPFDADSIDGVVLAGLQERLLPILVRTMVLEMHVARLRGKLSGATSQARYESFLDRIGQRDQALELFREYPTLARLLISALSDWCEARLELMRRLAYDWTTIRSEFSPEEDPGPLVELSDRGDLHRGGRAVCALRFQSGLQLMYKPRSLAVDLHFQQLLDWLNAFNEGPRICCPETIDCGVYGWQQFVAPQPCTSAAQLRRFYERQGGLLALLYLLDATDMTGANLIACGEHPMLIDLETLFQPRLSVGDGEGGDQKDEGELLNTVLRVGLLPHRVWANDESAGIDLSGLGSPGGQLTPDRVLHCEMVGSDEMHFVRSQIATSANDNQPSLNGQSPDLLHYAPQLVAGFTRIYRLLAARRDQLLATGGPLSRFADDEVRVVLRSTTCYSRLLQESHHPDMLRDAFDRDLLLDRLWIAAEQRPELAPVIGAERRDLIRGDIPLFWAQPGHTKLSTSSGAPIEEFFERPSLECVRDRLRGLAEDDLQRQVTVVRAALSTLGSIDAPSARTSSGLPSAERTNVDGERLLELAVAVGNRIAEFSCPNATGTSWIGLQLQDERHLKLAPLGVDLYDGLSGVALFLAYLGQVTRSDRFTDLARAAMRSVEEMIEHDSGRTKRIGGYSGWGGVIYTLSHLGAMWSDAHLLDLAERVARRVRPLIATDDRFDVLAGAAGCIAGLLNLHSVRPSEELLQISRLCGDHLIKNAVRARDGAGWVSKGGSGQLLAGFAHGAGGIAWSLHRLARATGDLRFRQQADAGVAYERGLYSQSQRNWRDLRCRAAQQDTSSAESFMTAWCHGATGIGLARLDSLDLLDPSVALSEVNAAVETTARSGFGVSHCLCHGDLGNLELLFLAARRTSNQVLLQRAQAITGSIVEGMDQSGWLCGVPLNAETPGLMTGLAGIGYGLLRIAKPSDVPSVLTLDPAKPLRSDPCFDRAEQVSSVVCSVE